MALLKKNTSQLQTQENDIHKALKAWYLTPGIQRDLRNNAADLPTRGRMRTRSKARHGCLDWSSTTLLDP